MVTDLPAADARHHRLARPRLAALALGVLALAACDRFDRSFGGDGSAPIDLLPNDAAVAGDGVAVIGLRGGGPALFRYRSDGTRDDSFGGEPRAWSDSAARVAEAPGDGLVVASADPENQLGGVVLVRYLADGTIDEGFGDDGVVRVDAPATSDVAVAPDGRMALTTPDEVVLVDPGGGVRVVDPLGDLQIDLAGAAFDPAGRVVVLGRTRFDRPDFDVRVLRLRTDGSLDPTFGWGGVAAFGMGGDDLVTDIAVTPAGRIVVLADHATDERSEPLVVAFTAAGRPDERFGFGGASLAGRSFDRARIRTLHVRPDGRLVAVGMVFLGNGDLLTIGWTADGRLDPAWGREGEERTDTGHPDELIAGALLADGRLLGVGFAGGGPALVRYGKP